MFTGLIETVCAVKSVRPGAGTMQLQIDLSGLAEQPGIGDSIAVNGVCLTVTGLAGGIASFDVSGETLAKSTLGQLQPARRVNVETAMSATGRFGGHFVQGHVDNVAAIERIEKNADFAEIRFTCDAELLDQMVPRGSVAVDGISLTITDMDASGFTVTIIPETLKNTTLGTTKIGNHVNIETDMIVKVIRMQLQKILPGREKLTVEKLKELGF